MNRIAQAAQAVKSQIATSAPKAQIAAEQQADGTWRYTHRPAYGLTRHSQDTFQTEAEAIYAAAIGKATDRITIRTSAPAVRATLIAMWQMDGIELGRRGFDPGFCENSYVWQGWASVAQRGIPVFGWPQPQEVTA